MATYPSGSTINVVSSTQFEIVPPGEPPPPPPPPPPPSSDPNGYTVSGRQILTNGAAIQLRGLNMFGFNSADYRIPQYLWAMGWKEQIQQVKDLGFNAIRVPFTPDTLYRPQAGYSDPGMNPELQGKTPLQVLDLWLAEVNRQKLFFILDFHSCTEKWHTNKWHHNVASDIYDNTVYTEAEWIRDLKLVATRYAHLPYFLGIDPYNEPHGEVRWGPNDVAAYKIENDWKLAVEKVFNQVGPVNTKILFFIEGIHNNFDGVEDNNIPVNWGENLRPQSYLSLSVDYKRLVFLPHTYGPDVYDKSTFSAPNFPANLPTDWEALFGRFDPVRPVLLGEFGGKYGTGPTGNRDRVWQNALVDWLISKGIRSSFYWCYTPNSGDTGGILNDDLTVNQDKMALLHRLWGV